MAIIRQRLPIPGPFDIRIGLPRDKGFDPQKARKRLKEQKANPETTVNRFRSMVAGAEGLYRPAKYLVVLEFPTALQPSDIAGSWPEFQEYITDLNFHTSVKDSLRERLFFFCSGASLPERTIQDTSANQFYGPERNIARGLEFAPMNLTFMLDSELSERAVFETWQNLIINQRTFNANFYDEYIGKVFIFPLHENRNERSAHRGDSGEVLGSTGPLARLTLSGYYCELIEAYPKTVHAVDLGYGKSNEFANQSVTFNYRYWRSNATLHDHERGIATGDIDGVGRIKDPRFMGSGFLGSILSRLPPEIRRAGRDVWSQIKTKFPTGRIFGGKVFPPFF